VAPTEEETPATPALEFFSIAELRARVKARGPRRRLLSGLWPSGDYGVLAAEQKAQKTWGACALAVAVASGTPWLGLIAVDDPGPVIMFAGEGNILLPLSIRAPLLGRPQVVGDQLGPSATTPAGSRSRPGPSGEPRGAPLATASRSRRGASR
jgi:hypothetical protein